MSTYKIYQIIDANKSTYSFRLTDTKKHVDFISMTFGSKFSDGKLTYGTSDPAIQEAIENLPKFKSGVITLEREEEQEDDEEVVSGKQEAASGKKASGKKASGKQNKAEDGGDSGKQQAASGKLDKDVDNGDGGDNEVTEVSEPTNVQEAKDWLKTNKGIAAIALSSIEKVKAQTEKAGVTFPNVVWPE